MGAALSRVVVHRVHRRPDTITVSGWVSVLIWEVRNSVRTAVGCSASYGHGTVRLTLGYQVSIRSCQSQRLRRRLRLERGESRSNRPDQAKANDA